MKSNELRKWLLFGGLSVAVTIGSIIALLGPGLRYGLDRAIDAMPADVEERLGLADFDSVLAAGAIRDPALDAALAHTSEILNTLSPGRPVRVYILPDSTVNAFATPGGGIFLHTGILASLDDQGELFAVLGHELAHVRRRHGLKSLARAAGLAVTVGVVLGDASALVGLGAQMTAELLQRGYGRRAEEESDADAIRTLDRLGLPREAMTRVLTDLEAANPDHPPEFLSTHPSPETRRARIAELSAALGAPGAPVQNARLTPQEWAAIRGAGRAPSSPTP